MSAANSDAASDLRQKAEELLKKKPVKMTSQLSEAEKLKIVHELEVHQVELELQNEELRIALSVANDTLKLHNLEAVKSTLPPPKDEIVDIDGQMQNNEALQNAVALTHATFESIHNGILVVGNDGKIIRTNGRFAEMWQIPADIFSSANDKRLLDYILIQLSDPEDFLVKVSEMYANPQGESLDMIHFRDGRIFERISKPMFIGSEPKGRVWSFLDITERIRAEDELREVGNNYLGLFNAIQQAIYIQNPDLTFINVNQGACEMYGYEREYFIGKTLEFLSAPGKNDLNHVAELVGLAFNGQPQKYEFWGEKKDGTVFSNEVMTVKGKYFGADVLITVASDISERVYAQNALLESEAIYRNLVLRLPDGVYKSTHEGRFLDVNPAMVSMLGYASKEELMAIDIKTQLYFEPTDRESLILQEKLEETGVYRLKKKDGTGIWVEDKGWYNLDEKCEILSHEGILRDVTDRKLAEELLQFSEERYRTIVDNLGEGVGFVNAEDRFEFANIAAEEIFGVGLGGLVGMSLEQFVSAEQYRSIQRETALRVKGIKSVYELDIQRPNNDLRTIVITAVPQFDKKGDFIGTYGVFRDITKRKQTEKALRHEQYLLHALMNNVPDHIYFKDSESRFIRINKAQARLFGLSDPDQAIGKTDFDFFTNEHARQAFEDEQEIIRTGEPISKEERETWEDHPDTWVLTSKMPLVDSNNRIIGTFGISMNIDDRKKAEAEIRLKNEELHRMNVEKDKFFSIIAHDLRSPFNGFLGLTELMVEDLPTMSMDDIKKIALIMRTSATNLFNLLGNLLDWSRMQRGLSTFSFESFLLKPRISESMVFVMDGANKKGIVVSYDIPGDLEVYADRNMVGGIIRNIASNAVKFTNKGGNIAISAKTVADNFVEISIKDNGIGMNQEMIDYLFLLDVNTSRSGTEGECSTGLGLILCKDFIEKHGGKLWVESEEGKGSTFRFTLPGKMKE